jgi:hypothetical protein
LRISLEGNESRMRGWKVAAVNDEKLKDIIERWQQ